MKTIIKTPIPKTTSNDSFAQGTWKNSYRIFMLSFGQCMLKLNNRKIRRRCEMCSKLITKTLERCQ